MRLNDADARSVIVFIHYCRTVYMQTLKTVNNRLTLHATCLGTQLRATKDFFLCSQLAPAELASLTVKI